MQNAWFSNNGQAMQLAVAVCAAMMNGIGLARAVKLKSVWWIRSLACLMILLLSAVLFIALEGSVVPRWLAGILGIILAATIGLSSPLFRCANKKDPEDQSAGTDLSGPQAYSPEKEPIILDVLDIRLERADQYPRVEYKRKLRIILKNTSSTEIIVGPGTKWQTNALRVRTIPEHKWELEPNDGWHSDKWTHNETAELRVPPGRAFRTWIGLHNGADEAEIAPLREGKQLGELVVPIRVIGSTKEKRMKF